MYQVWACQELFIIQDLLDGGDYLIVDMAVGCDDASVLFEFWAVGVVEGFAGDVGDGSAGLLGDDHAGSVVPDFFAVVCAGGQSKVDRCLASGDDGVLRLGVKSCRFGGDAE